MAANIATPDTDKAAALPAHRGAAAYIDGTERTFLEKYSDYMWGGILLLSGLGSAGAWFRSYLKRDEKVESIALRDRTLALIARARHGNSVDELQDMQHEVDGILREILVCYDDGAIDEGDLSAFSLVFEQFHHADRGPARGAGEYAPGSRAFAPGNSENLEPPFRINRNGGSIFLF